MLLKIEPEFNCAIWTNLWNISFINESFPDLNCILWWICLNQFPHVYEGEHME